MGMKTRRAKACDIPQKVKEAVWDRDNGCCIVCGSPRAMPNAHYISRAHGGLGTRENIVTLCQACHNRYDNGTGAEREAIAGIIREYLLKKYPGWKEADLIYRKENSNGK